MVLGVLRGADRALQGEEPGCGERGNIHGTSPGQFLPMGPCCPSILPSLPPWLPVCLSSLPLFLSVLSLALQAQPMGPEPGCHAQVSALRRVTPALRSPLGPSSANWSYPADHQSGSSQGPNLADLLRPFGSKQGLEPQGHVVAAAVCSCPCGWGRGWGPWRLVPGPAETSGYRRVGMGVTLGSLASPAASWDLSGGTAMMPAS